MKMISSLLLNPAIGGSFAYGAYQTWRVIKMSMGKSTSSPRRVLKHQERILKFWIVMICMLTVTPLFDFFFGIIFGPLWTIFRLLIFWQVAYSKTLGSGWLFEQYEVYAPFIENYILEVIIIGRQIRTALLDFVYSGIILGMRKLGRVFIAYASRGVLHSIRVRIKEAHWQIQSELKKHNRPGHRRVTSTPKGDGEFTYDDGVQMAVFRSHSGLFEKGSFTKEK